jgi:hypothetical protein
MRLQRTLLSVVVLLVWNAPLLAESAPTGDRNPAAQDARTATAEGQHLIITAMVRDVLASRVFTVDYGTDREAALTVWAPNAQTTPAPGTRVLLGGVLRQLDRAERDVMGAWENVDEPTRARVTAGPVLVARSLHTADGQRLTRIQPSQPVARAPRGVPREGLRDPGEVRLHADALALLIDEVGGHQVTLPTARVIAVINPRAFLIESSTLLPPMRGNLDRVLVLVDGGGLRVAAAAVVNANVRVRGVARSLLGVQVTGEVPWPAELTPQVVRRLEIRGVVLASSIQTTDGVELTERREYSPDRR